MATSIAPGTRRRWAIATFVGALVLAGACGDDGGADGEPGTTTETTATSDTTAPPAETDDDDGGADDGGADEGGDDTGGDGDEVLGTLTVDGTEVPLIGFCAYRTDDPSAADVATAQVSGVDEDGEPYGVQMGVSGSPDRRTQVRIALPDTSLDARWEQDGSLSQSNDDGAYAVGDGRLEVTVSVDGRTATVSVTCDEL